MKPLLLALTMLLPLAQQPAPPSMAEINISSHGSRMNGLIYLAAGDAPRPVVIFLHGFPGNEKNLDLAQAVRRAGYQAVYIDYRGNWGSAGTFSFANGLEDVDAVLAWVRSKDNADTYHFDTTRIAIVGHSYGGWLALMTAAHEQPSVCVAGLAAWNIGWAGARFAPQPGERDAAIADLGTSMGPGGPINTTAENLVREMSDHGAAWNYIAQAGTLKNHAVLLVSATNDSLDEGPLQHKQLADAIQAAGGTRVTNLVFDDDHPFSAHRLELADVLIKWLKTDCASK